MPQIKSDKSGFISKAGDDFSWQNGKEISQENRKKRSLHY